MWPEAGPAATPRTRTGLRMQNSCGSSQVMSPIVEALPITKQ